MLRAMSFAQWKNDSSFDRLVEWANQLLAKDHRENLVSIVVLEDGRPSLTLADVDRKGFDYIVDRKIINRYSTN
jgi:hypothetical protein